MPAPVAALLAAITGAVFRNNLPWDMMCIGASVIFAFILGIRVFKLYRFIQISILGIAIGMYLPVSSSFPLFIGGLIALFVKRRLKKQRLNDSEVNERKQIGTRIACGLVAGSALLDVLLAIPFSIYHSPDAWRLVSDAWDTYGLIIAVVSTLMLAGWMQRQICR